MKARINDQDSFKTLWIFNHANIDKKPTWKYLDHVVKKVKKEQKIYWVKNPHFAYKHLSPYHVDDITVEEAKRGFDWKEK